MQPLSNCARRAGDQASEITEIFRRQARWAIYPRGWWTERDGSHVIFDRKYRPLCRVRTDGSVELTRPDEWITHESEGLIYQDHEHPEHCATTREKLYRIIDRLGLADELKCRRDRQRRRELPSASHVGRR